MFLPTTTPPIIVAGCRFPSPQHHPPRSQGEDDWEQALESQLRRRRGQPEVLPSGGVWDSFGRDVSPTCRCSSGVVELELESVVEEEWDRASSEVG